MRGEMMGRVAKRKCLWKEMGDKKGRRLKDTQLLSAGFASFRQSTKTL